MAGVNGSFVLGLVRQQVPGVIFLNTISVREFDYAYPLPFLTDATNASVKDEPRNIGCQLCHALAVGRL